MHADIIGSKWEERGVGEFEEKAINIYSQLP